MARTIAPVTATSASWKVMARAWRTTRAPILISFSWRLAAVIHVGVGAPIAAKSGAAPPQGSFEPILTDAAPCMDVGIGQKKFNLGLADKLSAQP